MRNKGNVGVGVVRPQNASLYYNGLCGEGFCNLGTLKYVNIVLLRKVCGKIWGILQGLRV